MTASPSLNFHTCATCRFGILAGPNLQDLAAPRAVDCRRMPPEVVLIDTPTGPASMLVPRNVPPDHWCGEFDRQKQGQPS